MTALLVALAVGVGLTGALGLAGRLLARRRRRALERDGAAVWRVRLRGSAAPYPAAGSAGRLTAGPGVLTWAGRGGPVLDLHGAGLRVLGPRPRERGDGAGQEDVVLAAADGTGTAVRLVGRQGALEQLEQVLRARPLPGAPQPVRVLRPAGRPPLLLPALVALVGAAGLALSASVLLTAVPTTGTTVGEADADDYCAVRWTDPRDGRTETRSLDCYWDVGDEVDLLLPGAPLDGAVLAAEDPGLWAGASGLLLVTGAGLGARRAWRRRADLQQPPAPAAPVAPLAAPERLAPDRLERADVERVLRARARSEGWSFDLDPALPPQRAPRRLVLLEGLAGLLPLAGGALAALLLGWTGVAGLWASAGPTVAVDARATGVEPFGTVPLLVDDVEVVFDLRGGGRETTLVALRDSVDPAQGDVVRLRYDPDDPDRVRAVQDDGAPLSAGAAALALLVGAGWTGVSLTRAGRHRRARSRARRASGRSVPYLLAPDEAGTCWLLLHDAPHGPPRHALVLAGDPRGRVPGAGTVEVRGRYLPGEVVVALVDGRELPLDSPLLDLDAETAASVVSAEPLGDDGGAVRGFASP